MNGVVLFNLAIFFIFFNFLVGLPSFFFGSEENKQLQAQDFLIADRYRFFKDSDLDLGLFYMNNVVENPVGGRRKGIAYCDSYWLTVSYDLENKIAVKGLSLNGSAFYRGGDNLSKTIGNQFNVNQIYGEETIRLAEFYFMVNDPQGHYQMKLGRICPGDDFVSSSFYNPFINNSFNGTPAGIKYNFPFVSLPCSVWGSYLSINPKPNLIWQMGIYTTNTRVFSNDYNGLNLTFKSPQGDLLISELIYLNDPVAETGHYKIGAAYLTGKKPSFTDGRKRGNYTLYFLGDQILYRLEKDRNLATFFGFFYAPEQNLNTFPYFSLLGFAFKGIFPSRQEDVFSLGGTYAVYSKKLREAERKSGIKPQFFEIDLELNYLFQISDYCTLTPSIQYIINPSGYGTIPNAMVLGIQTFLKF